MTEFYKSELKDRILRYTMDRDDYIQPEEIYSEFLKPNYKPEFVMEILDEILDFDRELFDVISGNGSRIFMLSATPRTTEFLEAGGFKELFLQEEEKWETFLKHLSIDARPRRSTKDPTLGEARVTVVNGRRDRKVFMTLLGIIGFSFLYSLVGTIGSLTTSPGISQREFDARLEELQRQHHLEMENLKEQIDGKVYTQRITFTSESDSLHRESKAPQRD